MITLKWNKTISACQNYIQIYYIRSTLGIGRLFLLLAYSVLIFHYNSYLSLYWHHCDFVAEIISAVVVYESAQRKTSDGVVAFLKDLVIYKAIIWRNHNHTLKQIANERCVCFCKIAAKSYCVLYTWLYNEHLANENYNNGVNINE